jgi:TolA protein
MNPPPPPPHGEAPKSSGLPPGKYDIFIIPPHSSGSGFLYLPSLQPNVNSFAAGFASALILVALASAIAPALRAWWDGVKGAGGMGVLMVMLAIGVGAWALGRTQADGGPGPGGGGPGQHSSGTPPQPEPHQYSGHSAGAGPPPTPNPGPHPNNPGGMPQAERPKPGWQRTNPPPGASNANTAKSAWEKAREETKKKEEERKAKEADKKRREDLEKRLKEVREKEAREREARERKEKDALEKKEKEAREKEAQERKVKEAREREAQDRKEKEALEKKEKEAREKMEKEALEKKEKDAREARERKEKEAKATAAATAALAKAAEVASTPPPSARLTSTYAFSSTGEKTNPWPQGNPAMQIPRPQPPSPTKKPPPPTAKTYLGTEDDAHSFRPYDKPKKPTHKKSLSSLYSESSYAASHSTSRTTPPPSHRGPYSTKDPDKIVIKAVYAFTNAFLKTPTSQLVSGAGSVTDGLILRITTEGLFIDDDVRGVPQREWDVKAWTMKLVEVWCPAFSIIASAASQSASRPSASRPSNPVRRLWNLEKDKAATNEEADAILVDMLGACKDKCRLGSVFDDSHSDTASSYSSSSSPSKTSNRFRARQTGELNSAKLHILRASIRDQEGKRYVFIISEEESWKVAIGLQRLRKGTQVRALGVSGMSANDAKTTLENLGWA